MQRARALQAIATAAILGFFPAPALGEGAPTPATPASGTQGRGLTLKQCIELADHNHPNILAARSKVEGMRAQLDEARTAPFSAFTLTAGAGPAPTFRGGQIYTQDREVGLNSNLGMAWQANLSGTIPLWTFGKITSLRRAAEAQIRVGEAEAEKIRNAVRMDVRRAYFGVQLAREARALLEEADSRLGKALEPLQKKIDEGDGDEVDLIRLQLAQAELEGRTAEARRAEQVALAALRFYTGVEQLHVPPEPLQPPRHELGPLESYQQLALQHRPELKMARAGLSARKAQVDLAKAKLFPDIGLSLFGNYSRAPEITDQLNPFVRDDANYLRYGLAFGVRWSLDFLPAQARVRQSEAQLGEMEQTSRFALGGVATEVEKAHAEATEQKKKTDAFQRASKLARQWMIRIAQGIDVGTSEERDLVDPARQYALQRYNYLAALMDYNLAISNLALATGHDAIAEGGH
ncbi:MAG: TolC family protein [Polyangiaceae bacterium]|nr:TolC family protein [Polyangiaceae bacterium]